MEQGRIAERQFTILVVMFIIGSSILLIPAAIAIHAKQDAWLSAIIGVVEGLAIIGLLHLVGKELPSPLLVESFKLLLGKWIGTLVSILFVLHAFFLTVFMIRYIGDFMATQIMPETPVEAIHIVFILLVILASRYGLETLARSAEVFLPWVLLFVIVLSLFVLPQLNGQNLLPVIKDGMSPVLKGTLPLLGIPFLELVLFLMLYPNVDGGRRRGRAFMIGGAIGGLLIIVITFMTIAVLGPYLTVRNIYPSFALTKQINIGQFLQRIEALLAITWFLTIFYKTTVCFHVSALGIAQVLKLKSYKTVVLPLGFLIVVYASIVYPNIVYGNQFAGMIWTPYASVPGLALPLILLAVIALRKKVRGRRGGKTESGKNAGDQGRANPNSL
ncbi:endospore germination permease [Paenibacillus hodogayensis]|uniref:Endospore germination permease n=1 Tax=Paenibacillus hodogayensis TaxID=279208 RepID=A0ABV5W0M3_9BACL